MSIQPLIFGTPVVTMIVLSPLLSCLGLRIIIPTFYACRLSLTTLPEPLDAPCQLLCAEIIYSSELALVRID